MPLRSYSYASRERSNGAEDEECALFTAHVTAANGPHCAALHWCSKSATSGCSMSSSMNRCNGHAGHGPIVYVHATPRPGLDADMFVEMVVESLVVRGGAGRFVIRDSNSIPRSVL